MMTEGREQLLKNTQMKMMRTILAPGRLRTKLADSDVLEIETWVDWVKRATAEARQALRINSIPDWVELQRERILQWNARLREMECHRWARQVLAWTPDGNRLRGRPRLRWADKSLYLLETR